MVHNRILIAEDSRRQAGLHHDTLQRALPSVMLAVVQTRAEFARCIESSMFDCAVLDSSLVDCSADEMIGVLRRRQPECPAIIVSTEADRGVAMRALRRGAVEVVGRDEAATGNTLCERVGAAIEAANRRHRDRRRRQRREHRPSETPERDAETGLVSRAAVERLFNHSDRRVFDRRGHATVLLLELDVAPSLGAAGARPESLRLAAEALRQSAATSDTTCRWSESTLLALRPDTPFARAVFHAEQLRRRIARLSLIVGGRRIGLTACIGVATVRSEALAADTIDRAAAALAEAKRDGPDRVRTFERVEADALLGSIPPGDVQTRITELYRKLTQRLDDAKQQSVLRSATRTADIAAEIARHMRLDARTVERVRLAGRCLELGGLCAPPDAACSAAIPLAEQRFLEEKLAGEAADLAAKLGADRETTACIRLHQLPFCEMERGGQRGAEHIPLGARIVRVARALVAMTSDRLAHSHSAQDLARQTLRQESGRLFDPTVVEAAVALEPAAPEDMFLQLLHAADNPPDAPRLTDQPPAEALHGLRKNT